ncbi:hypothetical protein [Rhizobium sp. EC-SD404]|uniref:hypothetical protein n=1 Tax=Rhizobium sp. EC-SD404 TaxID=2038389 RepID=UPI001251BA4D|nr:hypothetical protein [Rhizobium sp. EC-SD404]VVT23381.1 conserved exported hypothetical protein [Rhizobium sp. EC-SD404]
MKYASPLVFGIGLAVAGCVAPSQTSVPGPTGERIVQAKCGGSPDACFEEAAATCGGQYRVVDSHSNAGGALGDSVPGPVTWYNLSYICGPSDGRMPDFAFRGQSYRPATVTTCSPFGNSIRCIQS